MRLSGISRRIRDAERVSRLRRRGQKYPPALEWTEDMIGRCPRITAVGSHSLLVENHTGIAAFTDTRIVLNSRAGVVCAMGSGLSLSCAREGSVIIRGHIRRIELPCRGGDESDEE
jgi:sporulation protein YqfC